ncbi:SusF/SusE family outer membrane protein [Bacteroides caecigallinarum]|uniref:SusF/SusE family outer membrane protein n=1 Tax=Bacteroides caecigallinarum TaxID=1411144 RepID=UPI00195BD701|nr:SusF/SusE family outer membrane protein [Bacteroides caecigallinarum]MBM6865388.1 SusF/SusE family outer membrane protein [Bacteroides caecigallinarum]
MKKVIKNILMTLPFVIMGCQDETERITLDSPQDTMGLKVSSSDVVLNQDLGNEEAISFTWGSAANRGEGTKLTYYFKMDMADNNFETSIAKVEIPEGVQSISYTHKEMNALLSGWKVTAGETAMLEAEIIAEVSGGSVYMKPEISKVQFSVTGYYIAPRDLFIVGTAVEEMDAAKALKMKEVISEQKYEWGGHLKKGDFKFIKSRTSLTPSYTRGADDKTLVYNETDDGTETLFHIDKDGYYFITVDVEKLTIASEYPESIYEKVWAIGDATPAGWQPFSAVPLTKINNIQFVYEGDLYAGELKFPLELDENYYMSYLMPKTHGTEPGGDNTMEYVEKEKAKTHDYKWKITESQTGIYKIILDTYLMEITFEKKHDLPIKAVWMTGSATATQWNTPFEIAFNSDEKEGTFVWEGHLNTGEIKFPLSNTNGFECDYLMPEENGTSVTDAKKMVRKNYPDTTDENDHKWKVEEAGEYKISLNVIDMTVKFEKLY